MEGVRILEKFGAESVTLTDIKTLLAPNTRTCNYTSGIQGNPLTGQNSKGQSPMRAIEIDVAMPVLISQVPPEF